MSSLILYSAVLVFVAVVLWMAGVARYFRVRTHRKEFEKWFKSTATRP